MPGTGTCNHLHAMNTLRVLLVEDSPDDTVFFQHALKSSQLDAVLYAVSDGQEAIDYLRGHPPYSDRNLTPFPDMIVTDLKMPGVDGFGLLEWLREKQECSVIPIVVLSASRIEDDVRKAYYLGANAYMCKPNKVSDLAELLRALHAFWSRCEKPKPPKHNRCI